MPTHYIEVKSIIPDSGDEILERHLKNIFPDLEKKIKKITITDIYSIERNLSKKELTRIAEMLVNPVIETAKVNQPLAPKNYDYVIEIGFLPGVTDNIGKTVREGVEDLLKIKFDQDEGVYSLKAIHLKGQLNKEEIKKIANALANPLIQRINIQTKKEHKKGKSLRLETPKVKLKTHPQADEIDLDIPNEKLKKLGKEGIKNPDGTTRGPLALDLDQLKAIRNYFKKLKRKPRDIELESLAQTWSEHCKHTIFNSPIDNIKNGLFSHYIKKATEKIRAKRAKNDFCISVFKDNSGAIIFDEKWAVTHKVETHNTPSALDPFGGAITGIVGVNRDVIGFGLGAKPIINLYGFCFANPYDEKPLYKGPKKKQKMLPPRRIMEGVIEGVNVGGNCSGIPTPLGFVYFDDRYKGKPLVFVGTVGLIPRKIDHKSSSEKRAQQGDYIVMIGGRVGKDGIHGATFSSEALGSESPVTAVQIGDPITQKKFSDALVKEIRDKKLYHSITDCGAGGISCSIAEMAREMKYEETKKAKKHGGFLVELEKVPVKYANLSPWEIWISESQERMTLAIPPKNWKKFEAIMKKHDVESTIIGTFNNTGKGIITYHEKTIFDMDLEFLHEGLPQKQFKTQTFKIHHEEPKNLIPKNIKNDLTPIFHDMVKRFNIASTEFISRQYDHEVQGTSVIKPLQGKGRVNGSAAVNKPVYDSWKGIVTSFGIYPRFSDIDTYHMAACCIDSAIRNAISCGASLDHLAILDNFCWCQAYDSKKLYELKKTLKACSDYAISYGTPFISGKDSMFNDFHGFDENGKPLNISIPPTLLISTIGVILDVRKTVTLDFKIPGDLIYLLGETFDELGGSEYFTYLGEKERDKPYIGNNIPKVDAEKNKKIYRALHDAIQKDLIASAQSLNLGGLAIALAKSAIAGQLGFELDLQNVINKIPKHRSNQSNHPNRLMRKMLTMLFSESQGRLLVSIAPSNKNTFETMFKNLPHTFLGKTTNKPKITIKNANSPIIETDIKMLTVNYRSTFKNF